MKEITISKKQARDFVFECFDAMIRDIKAREEQANEKKESDSAKNVQDGGAKND